MSCVLRFHKLIKVSNFQRLGVSEDSNLTSSPIVVEPDKEEGEPTSTVPTPKPKRKSRFEPEIPTPQKNETKPQQRKDGKWDMFAEADNFGGQYAVSIVINLDSYISHS